MKRRMNRSIEKIMDKDSREGQEKSRQNISEEGILGDAMGGKFGTSTTTRRTRKFISTAVASRSRAWSSSQQASEENAA